MNEMFYLHRQHYAFRHAFNFTTALLGATDDMLNDMEEAKMTALILFDKINNEKSF